MAALLSLTDDDSADSARSRTARKRLAVVRILNTRGDEVCAHCELAESTLARMRGLLGRAGLEPGHGMLIQRTGSIQMFFMRFPIDVVFLGRDKAIVGIAHDVKPWRLAAARRARAALELPAGTAQSLDLQVGDVLTFVPVHE
jgi:uncharacterized membrane protein (UPF0127 family)